MGAEAAFKQTPIVLLDGEMPGVEVSVTRLVVCVLGVDRAEIVASWEAA